MAVKVHDAPKICSKKTMQQATWTSLGFLVFKCDRTKRIRMRLKTVSFKTWLDQPLPKDWVCPKQGKKCWNHHGQGKEHSFATTQICGSLNPHCAKHTQMTSTGAGRGEIYHNCLSNINITDKNCWKERLSIKGICATWDNEDSYTQDHQYPRFVLAVPPLHGPLPHLQACLATEYPLKKERDVFQASVCRLFTKHRGMKKGGVNHYKTNKA